MGLQVWLPLNGNLNNLGLDGNLNIINNGATVNASGKIGQCYSFNGNDQMIAINSPTVFNIFKGGTQQFSITFWVLHEDTRRAIIFGDWNLANSIGFNIELSGGHQVRFYWNGSPDWYPSINVEQNTWTHLAIVYNGTTLTIYKNGVITSGISWTGPLAARNKTAGEFRLGRDARTTDTALKGRLNDFRIYDHCLSVKEVEEISKGLILHYKLDGNCIIKNNNIQSSKIINRGCSTFTKVNENEWHCVAPTGSSGWGYGFYIEDNSITWNIGETWNISLEVKPDINCTWQRDINNAPTNTTSSGNDNDDLNKRYVWTNGIYGSQNLIANQWNTIEFTQIASTNPLRNGNTNWGIITTNLSNPVTFDMRNIKGEINERASSFISYGINSSSIVYDCSGYNYNGTITGFLNHAGNSPRYLLNSFMNNVGTANHIECNDIVNPSTDAITATIWVKSAKSTNQVIFAHPLLEFGTLNSLGYINLSTSAGWTLSNFIDNQWNFIVVIRQDIAYKLYVNGKLETQNGAGNNYLHNATKLYLLNRSYNNSYAANASISDFRLYASALTESQILELYNTSASVDKSGNMYAREVVE